MDGWINLGWINWETTLLMDHFNPALGYYLVTSIIKDLVIETFHIKVTIVIFKSSYSFCHVSLAG